jgi:hypothetical protein
LAFNHLGDQLRKQVTLGAFGPGMHCAGLVVIVQGLPEVMHR